MLPAATAAVPAPAPARLIQIPKTQREVKRKEAGPINYSKGSRYSYPVFILLIAFLGWL